MKKFSTLLYAVFTALVFLTFAPEIKAVSKFVLEEDFLTCPSQNRIFTLPLPDEGKDFILNPINAAKFSIDITAYKFSDPEMLDACGKAIKERNVKVRVLVEPYIFEHWHAVNEKGTDIEDLQKRGISVFTLSKKFKQMHTKIMVFDNKEAMILTCNLARGSFSKAHDSRNFAVFTDDKEVIDEMSRVFEADINGLDITPECPKLLWSPDNSRIRFEELIKEAKTSISFYQHSLSDRQQISGDKGILDSLVGALKRGITVKGLMPKYPFSKQDVFNIASQQYLNKEGAMINLSDHLDKKHIYIHAKVMIVDNALMYIGSCNWYESSIDDNREVGILLYDFDQIQAMQKVFDADFEACN